MSDRRGPAHRQDREVPSGQGGSGADRFGRDRAGRLDGFNDPEIPDDVVPSDLDRAARTHLRTLARDSADLVARHLVMVTRLLEDEPELAYQHATAAVRRGGRVDVVREAAGLAAYRTGRFAEALRELRTVRRLSGSEEYIAVMADCERGLGRPERALAMAAEPRTRPIEQETEVELAIVLSGARVDLGQLDAALALLEPSRLGKLPRELAQRVAEARAGVLEEMGRLDEAAALAPAYSRDGMADDDVVVFDLGDEDSGDEGSGDEDSESLDDSDEEGDEGAAATAPETTDADGSGVSDADADADTDADPDA